MSVIKLNNLIKLVAGIAVSAGFLYLAFGKIEFGQMKQSFQDADYWFFIPSVLCTLAAHWLRSMRWQLFLKSIKRVSVWQLFSATMIGYMGNTVLPAHLGEIFRANVVGNRENIPTSSVLATLVLERIIDILALLLIMVAAVLIYPFPEWVTRSGYIMFALTLVLFVFLILLKRQNKLTLGLFQLGLRIFPKTIARKLEELLQAFINGINGFQSRMEYICMFGYSIGIWCFYWAGLHLLFYSFDFINTFNLSAISSVVLLVITTISIVVPSSPGYVGAYHYLCQLSLELFGVPRAVGLSFAIVAHGLSILPTAIIGFFFAWKEGIDRLKTKED
jgi:glycosyltransferase 2 family protein